MRHAISLLMLTLLACTGSLARSYTLLPALREAWPAVRAQAEREAAAVADATVAEDLVKVDTALANDNPVLLITADWQRIEALVEGDITRRSLNGEIGQLAAGSLRERVVRFREARMTYLRQPTEVTK